MSGPMRLKLSVSEIKYRAAEVYKKIIGKCTKCDNEVLYNDSDKDVSVIFCPICGNRYYIPESMRKRLEVQLGNN